MKRGDDVGNAIAAIAAAHQLASQVIDVDVSAIVNACHRNLSTVGFYQHGVSTDLSHVCKHTRPRLHVYPAECGGGHIAVLVVFLSGINSDGVGLGKFNLTGTAYLDIIICYF